MTNVPSPPPDDPDELASALVDGLLSADAAEQAQRNPAVMRRVEEIMQVRAMLRAAPPATPAARDAALDAALAAFSGTTAATTPTDRPQHLRPVPATSRPPRRAATWLAAAAGIAVLGLVAVGIAGQTGDDDAETAESDAAEIQAEEPMPDAPASTGEAEGSDSEELDDAAGDSGAAPNASTEESTAVTDLGSVDEVEELEGAVRDSVDAGAGRTSEEASPDGSVTTSLCAGLSISGDPERGTATFTATASYQGSEVVVHVYDLDGELQLVATDESCSDVVDVPFSP